MFYATKQAIMKGNKDDRPYLFGLLEKLDLIKRELKDNEAVTSEEHGRIYIEKFAHKVFSVADHEDQTGSATRYVAKHIRVRSTTGSQVTGQQPKSS